MEPDIFDAYESGETRDHESLADSRAGIAQAPGIQSWQAVNHRTTSAVSSAGGDGLCTAVVATRNLGATPMRDEILLPAVIPASTSSLTQLTTAMGVPRDILPDDAMIARTWEQLPRLLNDIPPQYRTEHHLRMCVAVANGLFDAAINYVWNAAILRLRDRVRAFGLHLVHSFTGKPFDEKILVGLKDSELIDLCLRLNLISEDSFFFLDQCRDVRNNFSSAHPAMGDLDDLEVLGFLNRCTKHAMSDAPDPRAVDLSAMLSAVREPGSTPSNGTNGCGG